MGFPGVRMRRLRRTPWLRETLRETRVSPRRLFLPVFLDPTIPTPAPISSLPGHSRYPPSALPEIARRAEKAELGGLLLFGRPREKTREGEGAWDPEGAVPQALRMLVGKHSLTLVADVCLCAYTLSGHCGIGEGARIDNDATLRALASTAVAYAKAGADWVAPSAMADGQVGALRRALDGEGLEDTAILAYALKSASASSEPRKSGMRTSMPQPGSAVRTRRMVAAKMPAPPSGKS
ncbi:MAG: porphobilinogen synthase, partial [Candidatus Thermoplasmatota archaeon]|nr:porphobilinogen synthase [Candidatus Thermoplasmatota archaeon]